jgi:hypothetical protein
MGDRLTLEQTSVVASLMEVYGSPTAVRQKFAERFAGRDPPSRLTIYHVYAKFVKAGSVVDKYRRNAGRPRTGRSDLNIAVVQQAIPQSPSKSTTRCSVQVVQALTAVKKRVREECSQILAEMKNIQPHIENLIAFSDEGTLHTSEHVN